MTVRKTVSEKQHAANIRNGKLSKGPKTERGKEHSRLNAITHAFFSPHIPKEELSIFEEIQVAVIERLDPSTILQWIQAKLIVWLVWRCRCALNLEAAHLERNGSLKGSDTAAPEKPTIPEQWYGANDRTTNIGIRFLDDLIEQVRTHGYFPSDAEDSVRKAFGQNFLDQVLQWKETGMAEYLAVVTYREKAKMFHFEGWDRPEQPDGREILRDPQLMADMLAKVLEMKRDQLLELQHIRRNQENLASNANGGEPAYRYVASAFKELRRAIDFYERLQTMKL